jgi:hypothetical protein
MVRWRILAILALGLATTSNATAQTHALSEAKLQDAYQRVQVSMALSGKLKFDQGGMESSVDETATATHEFIERILETDAQGAVTRTARLYSQADVAVTLDKNKIQRTLRPSRRLLVTQRGAVGLLTFCPTSRLTREELDAADHFDTQPLGGLLPTETVAIGRSWTPPSAVVQALCHYQGLTENKITCQLTAVQNNRATVTVAGSAAGIDLGAMVSSNIQATAYFDLAAHRVVEMQWTQKDERAAGPISPASTLEVKIRVVVTPTGAANELSDVALVPVPKAVPGREITDLEVKDPAGRYDLRHTRDWYFVGSTAEHAVYRLMDRGEFVAQVTIAPWKKSDVGKHATPDEIKSIVANTPGWQQETLIKADVVKLPSTQWAYLVAGEGDLDGVRAVQYFYFIASPSGEQAIITFTATPGQSQKLGSRDLEFVHGFLLPGS